MGEQMKSDHQYNSKASSLFIVDYDLPLDCSMGELVSIGFTFKKGCDRMVVYVPFATQ